MKHKITGADYISPFLSEEQFREAALETFAFQMEHCAPYRKYVDLLGVEVRSFEDIPFMPIEFFKNHTVYCSENEPQAVFTSSGTTGAETSSHYVASLELYEKSFAAGFERFYGSAAGYSVFALLPSYLEREGSSLIYMVEKLQSLNPTKGGFYLYDFEKLAFDLAESKARGERILLIGVTFALLDFAEKFNVDLQGAVVMETGGMKGRRREISREELHGVLCRAFNVTEIHSEYGMTEMLSQCYSSGGGVFRAPEWVNVSVRSLQNPLRRSKSNIGGLNVIDLVNRFSCSFLATGDMAELNTDGSFMVLGRISDQQLRGCSMLTE